MMMACRSCALSTAFLMLAHLGVADEDATCNFADATCNEKAGHVLLQKAFRAAEEKTVVVQEPSQRSPSQQEGTVPSTCKTTFQGKCWFLSELGDTCASTCGNNSMNFSYVLSTEGDPVTPTLVGHIPSLKQEAWAALECYVPSEDRYHTANPNAAKHVDINIGTWSHPSCKLACPCALLGSGSAIDAPATTTVVDAPAATVDPLAPTATTVNTTTDQKKWCRWRQPPACAPEFEWKGVRYAGCASADSDHDKPWCQFHEQHSEGDASQPLDWSYCTYGCHADHSDAPAPAPLEEGCTWAAASRCVAEFDYEGTHYMGCTAIDHDAQPWCSHSNPYNGSWSNCQKLCPNKAAEDVRPIAKAVDPAPELEPVLECAWEQKPECSKSFQYKGIDYTGCSSVDHPTPWCSIDRVHKGAWTRCTRVCGAVAPPVTAVPVTSAPATLAPVAPATFAPSVTEDPCARHPEAENDALGATVTLDEAGYLIAAAAESPVNMKRFVCRAISKIGCRVSELSALMAFVPYYSGLVSHQTYGRLEAELTTLCHIGGKWVVPLSVDASGRAERIVNSVQALTLLK